jgi:hypothetical protein
VLTAGARSWFVDELTVIEVSLAENLNLHVPLM